MGPFQRRRSLEQMRIELVRALENNLIEGAMVKQGWWESEEDGMLYPPGYEPVIEEPVITEGKLIVEPEELEKEERKWWRLW